MTEISYATAVDPRTLPFKDRRTSLKVIGVLMIVFGAISACFGGLTPLGMWMSSRAVLQMPPGGAAAASTRPVMHAQLVDYRTMAMAGGFYLVAAALMIWIGVGSLRVRRWARPVMLVLSWSWLITGGVSFLHMILFGASMREMMSASMPPGAPPPPRAVEYVVATVMGTVSFLLLVLLPAVLAWLYQRRGVRETVQYFDQRQAWTDRCPTPVLAVATWLCVIGLGCAVYAIYAVLPVYGRFVTGAPAVAGTLALAALFAWLGYGIYRLRPAAWWAAALASVLWTGSMVWTFTRLGYHAFYRHAGYSPQQIDLMMRFSGQWEDSTVWMMSLWAVVLVACLLYVRKYFVAGAPAERGDVDAPPTAPTPAST